MHREDRLDDVVRGGIGEDLPAANDVVAARVGMRPRISAVEGRDEQRVAVLGGAQTVQRTPLPAGVQGRQTGQQTVDLLMREACPGWQQEGAHVLHENHIVIVLAQHIDHRVIHSCCHLLEHAALPEQPSTAESVGRPRQPIALRRQMLEDHAPPIGQHTSLEPCTRGPRPSVERLAPGDLDHRHRHGENIAGSVAAMLQRFPCRPGPMTLNRCTGRHPTEMAGTLLDRLQDLEWERLKLLGMFS
jgi:hypothetical protein